MKSKGFNNNFIVVSPNMPFSVLYEEEHTTITPISCPHITGSLMFLIQGCGPTYLCLRKLNVLYLDCTFFNPYFKAFPLLSESISNIISWVTNLPSNAPINLNLAMLGYENLLSALIDTFEIDVFHVSRKVLEFYECFPRLRKLDFILAVNAMK
ncbi:hypothetical protein ROZALSC1DRAFT_28322 [Rozella allomycis CSF55]|uniref:Uncharacterized protein n=1 Tax=Rozella allomycis (strain CSF55) TaxID=988480 RepID=A0A4P9YKM4_ROZAC|nr:hypothetical protein ROZALSC1DRAFT_28322 [Rozella allomycis CSF55]